MVITGPELEHEEDGRVSPHGEPAEFPGILHEGKIVPDKGMETDSIVMEKNGKQNTGKKSTAHFFFFFWFSSVVLSHFSAV